MSDKPESSPKAESENTFELSPLTDFSRFEKLVPASNSSEKRASDQATPSSLSFPPIDTASGATQNKALSDRHRELNPTLTIPPLDGRRPSPEQSPQRSPEQQRSQAVGADNAARAGGDKQAKATDQPLKVNADGKIEIGENDFERIGPKAAKVLKDAGVEKITITPGQGFDTYEATLKKPMEVAQDPDVDGCRKLKIGTTFKADVVKNADGSFTLDKIEGLTAESKILFKWQDASVDKIKLSQTPDGKSEITSTGSWHGISRDNTRIKDGGIAETAGILFGRMKEQTDAALKAAGKSR